NQFYSLSLHDALPISGSMIRIRYQLEGPAKLSVRMQEMFGLSQTPKLCDGKLALLMDLLSPAHRSLQLTEDLARFWQGSYKEVQDRKSTRLNSSHVKI